MTMSVSLLAEAAGICAQAEPPLMDFELLIHRWGADDGGSFRQSMAWLAARDSLEVAGQIIGIPLDGADRYTIWNTRLLHELSAFFERHGYCPPPKLWSATEQYLKKTVPQPVVREERLDMNQRRLTKEQYLHAQTEGKSDEQIASENGLKLSTLNAYRSKWGVRHQARDSVVVREQGRSTHVALATEPVSVVNEFAVPSELHLAHAEPLSNEPAQSARAVSYVTLTIPVVDQLPDHVHAEQVAQALKRPELLQLAYALLQRAVQWTATDMRELLGEEGVTDRVQAYLDRQYKGVTS